MQKIKTFLTFDTQAEEAARLYTSLFANSKITSTTPGPGGSVMSVSFELAGQEYIALNGGPSFSFASGMSLLVACEDQAEVDRLWAALTAAGGAEEPCGWLKDKFGVSWQIIPKGFTALLSGPDQARTMRVVQAMMKMKKLNLAELQKAYDGS
jgi:predicted 3-demethylubiquinone-9 3-methyltransferase (glyoxalase superfamily)